MASYPTWIKVSPDRWESEEQLGGTPDFILTREQKSPAAWRVKWRSSAKGTVYTGRNALSEAKANVAAGNY